MLKNKKIGFIGAGTMAKAIIKGLINTKSIEQDNILASEINNNLANQVSQELGITVFQDNKKLVQNSDIIILSTKPHHIKTVLEDIKNDLSKDKLVISIASGISTEFIESIINKEISVIRSMPNTPAIVGEGMTAICRGKYANDEQLQFAQELFSKVGKCIEVQEQYISAVTGISGSGPAFIYSIIEALADGGLKLGLPKKLAIELAAQTTLGAAKMILETGKHPGVLKDEVTTPGGCTIVGLSVMEEHKIKSALMKTVEETAKAAS